MWRTDGDVKECPYWVNIQRPIGRPKISWKNTLENGMRLVGGTQQIGPWTEKNREPY